METKGDFGALFVDDVQVGLFFFWTLQVKLNPGKSQESVATFTLHSWTAWASKVQMDHIVKSAEAHFYPTAGDYYWKAQVRIKDNHIPIGHLVDYPFEMYGSGEVEAVPCLT